MNILNNYIKKPSSPLQSVTIKLPKEMLEAVREFNVNLGAVVRDILKDSDLMQQYTKKSVQPKQLDMSDFSEEYFAFEHEDLRFYKHLNQYWTKDSNGTIASSTKNPFYRLKSIMERQDEK